MINEINDYTIYLITMDKQNDFWGSMNRGSNDMAKLVGVNYIWNAPQERDVDEQIQIFNKAVEQGADAIMLAVSDPVRISDALKEAIAKGVKIIYVDAPANQEAIVTLTTDNYDAGRIGIRFDFNNEIHIMIRNNILKAVLVQNPYTMGYLGMAEAIAALKDYETGPAYINTGVSILNRYTLARNR